MIVVIGPRQTGKPILRHKRFILLIVDYSIDVVTIIVCMRVFFQYFSDVNGVRPNADKISREKLCYQAGSLTVKYTF